MQEKLLSQKNFQGGVQLVSLSMNKVVRANKFLCGGGVPLWWTSVPCRGEQKYSKSLHAAETGISSGTDVSCADLTFTYQANFGLILVL